MKHYINKAKLLTLFSVISLSLSSCADFLIIEPKTFVTEDNFWNEKADVEQMVAGVYCMLQSSDVISRALVWGEVRSENIIDGYNVTNNEDLYRVLRETLKPNNTYTNWEQYYKAVNAAQIIIERAPSVAEKDPTYTPTQVMATQAEMKAIRALCMFYLVRAFKDVPYPTHAVQSEDDIEPMPAHSGDSIVKVLIADLEGCVSHALRKFPKDEDRNHNSNYNRFTQSGIYALLCDLCLWNGDYEKVVTYAEKVIDQKWQDFEETYSNNVNMESGGRPVGFAWDNDVTAHYENKYKGYPLYPCFSGETFGANFNAIFGEGNSFESVFELAFTPSSAGGNYISNSAVSSLYGSHANEMNKGPLFANEAIVNDIPGDAKKFFDHKYDIRWYINCEPKDDQYNEGYPSKYVCNSISITKPQNSGNSTLPFEASYRGSDRSDRNFIFYRLTDVMLMQAEALVELAGDDFATDENLQRAFGLVWAINRRSLMANTINEPTGTTKGLVLKETKYQSKDAMRELVMAERQRELMFEGKRWFDLLRRCRKDGNMSYLKEKVRSKGKNTGTVLFSNYESLYWPYYKRELKANTALTQKPFYGGDDGEDRDYQSSSKK